MRRPRRPPLDLRAVGGRRSRRCWRSTTLDGVQRAVRRRHPRRPLGRHGGRAGRAAGRGRRQGRRAHGHRLPVHRGGRPTGAIGEPSRPRPSPASAPSCSRPRPATPPAARPRPTSTLRRRAPSLEAAGADRQGVGRAGAAQPRPAAHRVQGPAPRAATPWSSVDEDEQRRRGHVHDRPGRHAARRGHDRRRRCTSRSPRAPPTAGRRRVRRRRPPRWSARGAAARSTSPSSAWPASCPGRTTSRRSGPTSWTASTRSPRCRPTGGTPAATTRPDAVTKDKVPRRRSGAGSSPGEFDALAYGIPPRSLASIEPCSCCRSKWRPGAGRRRLRHRPFDRSRASVIFGVRGRHRPVRRLRPAGHAARLPGRAAARAAATLLPELTEDSFPGVLANVIAGRIANRLDLGGVNFTVDAACASSLAALDLPARSW